jgi:hypothetical protein
MVLALFASGTYRTGTPYHTDPGSDPSFGLKSDRNPNINPDPDIHEKLKNFNVNYQKNTPQFSLNCSV